MAAPPSPPATGVTVSISRDPALVRTVRLVAAAVARRTGRDEDFVEEVRLAVGEACALLLGEASDDEEARAEPVTVVMSFDARLDVAVTSEAWVSLSDPHDGDIDGAEPWALLRGLVDDFSVVREGSTTRVSLSWLLS